MLTVLFFGGLQEKVGAAERNEPLPSPATVAGLKAQLDAQLPVLNRYWAVVRVAVNLEFAPDDTPLRDGDEVAIIPPVAGGSGHPRVELCDALLSVDRALGQVQGDGMGGLCVFAGAVRNHAHGRPVVRLDYSAYQPMALAVMARIVAQAEADHGATLACHHRVGSLDVGQLAVVIAAAAPHRDACFAAARQVIEALKQDAPIWKHEHGEDGAVWVGLGP